MFFSMHPGFPTVCVSSTSWAIAGPMTRCNWKISPMNNWKLPCQKELMFFGSKVGFSMLGSNQLTLEDAEIPFLNHTIIMSLWYCRWFSVDHVGENATLKRRIMVACPRHIHAFHVCFCLGYKVLNLIWSRYWQKIFKFRHCRKPHNWLWWANNMPPLAGCWQLGVVGSQGRRKCSGQSTDFGSLSHDMLDTEVTPNFDSWYLALLQNCTKWGTPNIPNRNSSCYGLQWILRHQAYFVTPSFAKQRKFQISNMYLLVFSVFSGHEKWMKHPKNHTTSCYVFAVLFWCSKGTSFPQLPQNYPHGKWKQRQCHTSKWQTEATNCQGCQGDLHLWNSWCSSWHGTTWLTWLGGKSGCRSW